MEDAGYTPANIVETDEHGRRPVGVFVGVMHKDYTLLQAEAASQGQAISTSFAVPIRANARHHHGAFETRE